MTSLLLTIALSDAPWVLDQRRPTAIELERWLTHQRPSVRVEYLASLLEEPR